MQTIRGDAWKTFYKICSSAVAFYLGVFALLATTSVLACYLPARRASRVDPLVTLRYE